MDRHYLYPGAIFASREPYTVDTLLGSCIAVTLWDSVLQFGSMNHYMLPVCTGENIPSFKYGDIAIPELIKTMIALGSVKNNLRAQVFGGSTTTPNSFNIGERNAKIAFDLLKKSRIPVVAHSLGGMQGRKIVFFSGTGKVTIKYIKSIAPDKPANESNTTGR